jgi:hypothetical protein
MTKHVTGPALLLTAGLASAGLLAADRQESSDAALMARVDRRVEAWQPTREERRLDEIGWAPDLREAFRLARQHHRPIFLFTYSGSTNRPHALALQRC